MCSDCTTDRKIYSLGRCRSCYDKNHRLTNPDYAERQRKNRKSWGKRFPEKQKAAYQNEWKKLKDEPEKWKAEQERKLGSFVRNKYGISLQTYRLIVAAPCGICGRTDQPRYLDHCHTTGKVRGALCHGCNLGVGFLEKRDQKWLHSALDWISNQEVTSK